MMSILEVFFIIERDICPTLRLYKKCRNLRIQVGLISEAYQRPF